MQLGDTADCKSALLYLSHILIPEKVRALPLNRSSRRESALTSSGFRWSGLTSAATRFKGLRAYRKARRTTSGVDRLPHPWRNGTQKNCAGTLSFRHFTGRKFMQNFSKVMIGLAALAVVIGIGVAIGWFGSAGSAPEISPPVDIEPSELAPMPSSVDEPQIETNFANPLASESNRTVVPSNTAISEISAPLAGPATNWQNQVDAVLDSDADDTNKVRQLFAIFPELPEDGQTEVAEHLANLTPNENYQHMVQLLENTNLSMPVLDVVFNDLLNRPDAIKLPLLLDIARDPNHPEATDAKDMLELYLDQDYGTDWAAWQQKIGEWIRANPQ